jgi:hypothetical protein
VAAFRRGDGEGVNKRVLSPLGGVLAAVETDSARRRTLGGLWPEGLRSGHSSLRLIR